MIYEYPEKFAVPVIYSEKKISIDTCGNIVNYDYSKSIFREIDADYAETETLKF